MNRIQSAGVLLLVLAALALQTRAALAPFGDDEPWRRIRPILGAASNHVLRPGQTLHDVAFEHRLGFEAIRRLNPGLDPWLPGEGSVVHLPTHYVLPPAEPRGLVVNVPEMRLYDFTDTEQVHVHAVAIGDPEDPTPTGRFHIGIKRIDPSWRVPESIRRKRPHLPEWVPPSPENPLGSRWMTLGNTSYGIHGTNVRWSIGRGATHGCIRLYDDVIQRLFDRVPEGTPVEIIYEPFKWGTNGKDLYLEVHPDVYGHHTDRLSAALELPRRLGLLDQVDPDAVFHAVDTPTGVPTRVGSL